MVRGSGLSHTGMDAVLRISTIFTFVSRLSLVVALATSSAAIAQDAASNTPTAGPGDAPATNTGLNLDMKLDDLARQDVVVPGMSTVVSTVERTESTIGRTPAAVFVITPEMIKRSGARSIPDVLRMAPGVDVARIDAHTWAISIRGFNARFANKLLVQIDGRIVYNATFGGVYWDQQDVLLADVERIEVIRGPGTTMWGSNAVNGVINILTKKSSDTQGLLVQSGGGGQDQQDFNTVRYGGKAGEDLTYRIWAQQFDRAPGWSDTGVHDGWRAKHGGFRMDYTPTEEDTFTLQGDLLTGYGGQSSIVTIPTPPFSEINNSVSSFPAGNILAQYERVIDEDTSWKVLGYYDRYEYNRPEDLLETRDTYNIDLQYQFSPAEFHHFITGANYRNSPDSFRGSFFVDFVPARFTTEWASVFAQDTMTLVEDRWYFTLGVRLEQNTFGGFQPEPTARLLFLPSERQSMWMAVSRAARNPTRDNAQLDVHIHTAPPNVPVFFNILGNPNIQAENLVAYEIGYRAAPTDTFSWDIAGYINDYDRLMGLGAPGIPIVGPGGEVTIPAMQANNTRALTYGFETTANYQVDEQWRLFASYSVFEAQAQSLAAGNTAEILGNSPHNMVYLRSSWDLGKDLQFDLIGRYVDRLSALDIPKYFQMDARIGWYATKNLEVSFVGQNLLDGHHPEFVDAIGQLVPTEVKRSWYGMISWTY
jgi:iron complex outermembrane recepter protein